MWKSAIIRNLKFAKCSECILYVKICKIIRLQYLLHLLSKNFSLDSVFKILFIKIQIYIVLACHYSANEILNYFILHGIFKILFSYVKLITRCTLQRKRKRKSTVPVRYRNIVMMISQSVVDGFLRLYNRKCSGKRSLNGESLNVGIKI